MKPETRQRRRGRTTRAINAYMTDKKGVPAVVRDTYRPVFHFYPDDQIEQLRERTLFLLETHGVAIEHEKAGALLSAAGATQTSDGKCYKLPRELLQGIDTGGNFLAEEHTARHCRSMFMPRVYQRVDRDSYEANNRRDVMDSALETYREIMDRPIPDLVMEADRIREIEQIVRAADADILAGD